MGGFGGAGLPLGVVRAVLDTGVRDLTLISNNAGSTEDDLSLWFEAKIVRKIVCSYPRAAKQFAEQYRAGTVELELVPQGTLVERIRAGGPGSGDSCLRSASVRCSRMARTRSSSATASSFSNCHCARITPS
nr:CoA-transferase [Tardiphaga robiniae]